MEINVGKKMGTQDLKATVPSTDYDIKNNRRMWNISTVWIARYTAQDVM